MTPATSTRERVLATVVERPGATIQEVAHRLALDHSTAAYHLHRLEVDRRVVAERHGRWRAHFVNGSGHCPHLRQGLPRLEARGARPALAHLLERGEVTAAELMARGIQEGEARWALQALGEAGFTERVARGRHRLAPDGSTCALRALARSPCPEWGSCAVSKRRAS